MERMKHSRGVRLEEHLLRQLLPTPNTFTGNNSGRLDEMGGSGNPYRGTEEGKQYLNPQFVEWMMGFPPGWIS